LKEKRAREWGQKKIPEQRREDKGKATVEVIRHATDRIKKRGLQMHLKKRAG